MLREEGIAQIKAQGPFSLTGEAELMRRIDTLLESFVAQHRMKLPGSAYEPCYVVKSE